MERISVSPEMTVVVGPGDAGVPDLPDPVVFAFSFDGTPTLAVGASSSDRCGAALRLYVTTAACRRLFGRVPDGPMTYHLSANLRTIALAVRDCSLDGAAGTTLRGAKCVELFCETFAALIGNSLVPANDELAMSERDTRRIVQARHVIDEQWREKLTLDAIARACGVNRAKLTRGYRALFGVTIAGAIAERRLGGARQMLLATDLPVSSVGYACGYQNNASFTRAFSRRFGVVPTRLRAESLAA